MPRRRFIISAGAILAAALSCAAAHAQMQPDDSVAWPVTVDSGLVEATGAAMEVVYSTVIAAPDAAWVRLRFEEALLPGRPGLNGAALRITSMADGAQQTLNATTLAQWRNTSAYFNGDAVQLELLSTGSAGPARVRITEILAGPPSPVATRNVCGAVDDRVPSVDPRAGRLQPGTCTAWLIDDECGCFLTAGHCMDGSQVGRIVEFNVPLSTTSGGVQHPPPQDQYPLDPESLQTNGGQGVGSDWATFGCFPNADTGMTPRVAQGVGYTLDPSPASTPGGSDLRITGYGSVGPLGGSPDAPLEWNLAQKTLVGPLTSISGTGIEYVIDTTGGNSGSPVVNELTGSAVAIHTHGACGPDGGGNKGTTIDHADLAAALANPLGVCAGPPLLTTDETAKLTATDAAGGDRFGTSVDMADGLIIAGAPRDDDRGSNSGSAYLYRRDGNEWLPETKLLATGGMAGDQLGSAVAVSGNLAAAAAAGSAGTLTTPFLSRVYVFRDGGAGQGWSQEAVLSAGPTAQDDWYGIDLALAGQTLIVGAPRDASGAGGVNTGAAWVYEHDGASWTSSERLVPDDAEAFDQFGFTVDVSGDAAVAGAPFDDDAGSSSGSAYVFRRGGAAWVQGAKLVAPDAEAGDQFGMSVAIDGDVIAVASPREASEGAGAGAVYVFRRGLGDVWSFEAKLTAPDATPGDEFGSSIAINGSSVVVGAVADSLVGMRSGSAYVFRHDGSTWVYAMKLAASDRADGDQFSASVAAAGGSAVAGCPLDDDAGSASGSAYVFSTAEACAADFDSDGDGDVFDLLAYLDLWFAGGSAADLDDDLDADVFDLLAFLDLWFPGC